MRRSVRSNRGRFVKCLALFYVPYEIQLFVASCQLLVKIVWGRATRPVQVLLLFRRRLLGGLLGRSLLLGRTLFRRGVRFWSFFFGWVYLLDLRFFLGQFGSLEALSAESDFRDADRGVRLPMSSQLLVLLLAFVVEHEDLCAAAFFDYVAHDTCIGLLTDLSRFAGNRQNGELHL